MKISPFLYILAIVLSDFDIYYLHRATEHTNFWYGQSVVVVIGRCRWRTRVFLSVVIPGVIVLRGTRVSEDNTCHRPTFVSVDTASPLPG